MLTVALYEVCVNAENNQTVITFSDTPDAMTTVICHSRIDMEEHLQILCKSIIVPEVVNDLWCLAGRCSLPNYHREDPIVINGYCGKYFDQALRFWNLITKFKTLGENTGMELPGNLPYSLIYSPSCSLLPNDGSRDRNAMLILHDYNGNYETHLLPSYDQLTDIVLRSDKLSQYDRKRILEKLNDELIIPRIGLAPVKTFKGMNAKFISEVINRYCSASIKSIPFMRESWAGIEN